MAQGEEGLGKTASFFMTVMIAVILSVGVAIPVVLEAFDSAGLAGTTTGVVVLLVPTLIALLLLVVIVRPIVGRL